MQTRILQLHKRSSYTFEHIQDKAAINEEVGVFALADGTTQSFRSEVWANILTERFVNNPVFEVHSLLENFREAAEVYNSADFTFSTNPAIASLERVKRSKGGAATFIGLQFKSHNQIEILTCGDSNVFLVRNDKIEGIPFNSVDELDNNGHFINTEKLLKNEVNPAFLEKREIQLSKEHKIILATDALSRFLLEKNEVLEELLKVKDFEGLHAFCMKYWENKMLQEDDISAIIIEKIGKPGIHTSFIQPFQDFSFPKEEQIEFIPSSLQQPKPLPQHFSPMQMNEIKEQFNGVAHDFYLVKRKLGFQQILLFLIAVLLVLNLIAFYFFYLPSTNKEQRIDSEPAQTQGEITPAIPDENLEPLILFSGEGGNEVGVEATSNTTKNNDSSNVEEAREVPATSVYDNQEIIEK